MTDISDSTLSNSMKIEHPGPESYNTMAIKLWSIMKRVYADLSDGFDWIYICGDDTFLMVEMLRAYLSTCSTGSPMYVGRRFQYVVFERNMTTLEHNARTTGTVPHVRCTIGLMCEREYLSSFSLEVPNLSSLLLHSNVTGTPTLEHTHNNTTRIFTKTPTLEQRRPGDKVSCSIRVLVMF